jgi:predicted secreted protein
MPTGTSPRQAVSLIRLGLLLSSATWLGGAIVTSALAGDAAGRRVIGFSTDGRYFAFEQYWAVYEDEASVSEIHVIDTAKDDRVPGSPIRVVVRGEEGLETGKARADAAKKAEPMLARFETLVPPLRVGTAQPSRDIEGTDHYQLADPFSTTLNVALPGGKTARVAIATRPLGTRVCRGPDRSATPARMPITGYTLEMRIEGEPTTVLHADKSVPASRGCPDSYGLAEAYLYEPTSGKPVLILLLEYSDRDNGHAGPNRRFLAVAHRLAAP